MVNVSASIGSTQVVSSPKTNVWASFSGDFNGSTWSASASCSAQMQSTGAWWNTSWSGTAGCNNASGSFTYSGGSRHSGKNIYTGSCSFNASVGEGGNYTTWVGMQGNNAYGSVTMPYLWKDPSFSASISIADTTPATGKAAGSGTNITWSWSGSWNSVSANKRIYMENFKDDGSQYVISDWDGNNSGTRTFKLQEIPSGYNNVRVWMQWNNSGGSTVWTQLQRANYTLHTYVTPSITATQTLPSTTKGGAGTMIAGTSSISVPYSVTAYNTGDTGTTGSFRHRTKNRVRNGTSNTTDIQTKTLTKGTGSGTTTFNSNLSNLDPNDSYQIIMDRTYENADAGTSTLTVLTGTVSVIHREPSVLRSVSYQATNRTTNTVVSEMVEGYSYDIKMSWTVPSDWGTRSGNRMVRLSYHTQATTNYDLGAPDTGSQTHNVEVFTPAVTGTDRATTYYVQSYAYIDTTSNKSDTTTTYLPVKAKIKPTASGVSLSAARVTTSASPTLLMADTPSWGNTQVSSSRLVTYELFIDGVHDSYHYIQPGGSKQITAEGAYGWGDHTAYVKATYESDLGSTTYTTNTVNIEIGDYPFAPTVSVSPLSIRAGQARKFTWTISPNDWNLSLGRCFTYSIDVDGVVKESGTKTATTTSISYTQIYPAAATVTLKIYQTNQLGNSALVTVSGILTDPIEPTATSIFFSTVPIALPDQVPVIDITREDNGTYEQNNATIQVDYYHNTTKVSTPIAKQNISMTATSFTMPQIDLSGCMDGTYSYKVTYIKYYTTGKTVTTVYDQQIVPPEVVITDNSYVTADDQILHIRFNIRSTFDRTNPYYIEYSMDYKNTWTRINNVMSYDLQCQRLDEIYIRAFGKNPVDSELSEPVWYEIPSLYHLKGSDNGGTLQTLRRIWASDNGGTRRKVKRIKK